MNARMIVLLLLLELVGQVPLRAEEARPARFEQVIEARFRGWDRDGDGKLSAQEINALVVSHKVTGDEAAAVAAIHAFYRDHAKANPVTRPQLTAKGPARKGTARNIADLYTDFRDHIRNAPREVFTGSGGPRLQGMHQGDMGDCYLIAVVGAAVHRDPAQVRRMFHPQKDGSCEVVFLGGTSVKVPKLTDAQIALGSTAGKQGLWLNILEEAYARSVFKKAPAKEKKPGALPEDLIGRGGDSADTIAILSHNRVESLDFVETKKSKKALQDKLVDALKRCMAGRYLMTAGGRTRKPPIPGVDDGHEYAVLAFDAKKKSVTIWNPHGDDFEPSKSPPGLKNGYETKGGRFEVPVADFQAVFGDFTWETEVPRKKK